MRIFKYTLEIVDEQVLQTPEDWVVLSVQVQNGEICLWAIVDENMGNPRGRTFYIRGTGHELQAEVLNAEYLGTCQTNDGRLAWHVFVRPDHA